MHVEIIDALINTSFFPWRVVTNLSVQARAAGAAFCPSNDLPHISRADSTCDDMGVMTDDDSAIDDEERAVMAERGHVDVNGNSAHAPKKTVAQIMRDKKKQTALTLQW